MNWKRDAEEDLRSYTDKRMAIENMQDEIHRLEEEATMISSPNLDPNKAGGGHGGGPSDRLINNISRRQELERRLKNEREWFRIRNRALNSLTEDEKYLLDTMVIHRRPGCAEAACEKLHVEIATIYREKNKALRAFTRRMYGITEE